LYIRSNSSIRFEKLREGLVDFEKIGIIKKLAANSTDNNIKNSIEELEQLLQSMTVKNDFSGEYFSNSLNKGKKILEKLIDFFYLKGN
jgi:hypothetical protein